MRFFRAPAWLVYQGLLAVFLLLGVPFYALSRGGRGLRHYLPTLKGRATLDQATSNSLPSSNRTQPASARLWIHAVSVGEAGVAATFARRLPADLPLVVTTITPTGQAQAKRIFSGRAFEGRDVQVAFLPFDFSVTIKRFTKRFRPIALVLTEGDYWPLTLSKLSRAGIPIMVANGRLSDRAFRRQARLGSINSLFYEPITCFGMQTLEDRRRLIELGVDGAQIHVTGNLKFDTEPPAPLPELERGLQRLANERPILIAGSTMEGEDEQVLDAFEQAGGGERAMLILVPRHPERWDRVARLIQDRGFSNVRRSQLDLPEGEQPSINSSSANDASNADVVLLDSLGELASLYRIAAAAFIGGTLVPTGGHNPLEPALFGTPTVVGPSMHNFQEMADNFDRAQAWGRATHSRALGQLWQSWLDHPELGRKVGQSAITLLDDNKGAVDHTLKLLNPLLAADRPID